MYPTWPPDGSPSLAYLSLSSDDNYHSAIFAADLPTGQAYRLELDPVLEFSLDALRTIDGALGRTQ